MNDRELMQQALEALERYGGVDQRACDAEEALRERLAQPEQEPVAWMYVNEDGECEEIGYGKTYLAGFEGCTPLYTNPPQRPWVGLTKEEAKEISLANRPYVIDMVAALEARLKEKNT